MAGVGFARCVTPHLQGLKARWRPRTGRADDGVGQSPSVPVRVSRPRGSVVPFVNEPVEHPVPTCHGKRYLFHPKHHGCDNRAARWLLALSLDEEFGVFDGADQHSLADDGGNLYGVLAAAGEVQDVGTCGEQVAAFPAARDGEPWHGYPAYPLLLGNASGNRSGESGRPPRSVLDGMLTAGLLTQAQRRRLAKGEPA